MIRSVPFGIFVSVLLGFCAAGARGQAVAEFADGEFPVAEAPVVEFIENKGQWADDIGFLSRVPGGKMVIAPGSFRYYFFDYQKLHDDHMQSHAASPDAYAPDDFVRGHAVHVSFAGANPDARAEGIGRSPAYYNYFLGNDTSRWSSRVHGYEGVHYTDFYPGIDLAVYAAGGGVKYDFHVSPGIDPGVISLCYQGMEDLSLRDGDLSVTTSLAGMTEQRPRAWQVIDGERRAVACRFALEDNVVRFVLPEGYDPCYPLVIDPLLIFSTFSGSTADNWGSTATPGEHGNLYSAGVTEESNGGRFPATPGAFSTRSSGLYDIGILKYDSLGTRLLYATYLGGSASESPHSLVMNDAGELVLLGTTSSADYPTTPGAYRGTFSGGSRAAHVVVYDEGSDIVLARFSADGTKLLASTYFGGSQNDGLNPTDGALTRNYGDQLRGDVITDAAGNIYVSSVTASPDVLATTTGYQTIFGGGVSDALLVKMDADLTTLLWGTYLGGHASDAAYSLTFDAAGNLYLAGGTGSSDFPMTTGTHQTTHRGSVDGWIARVSADGQQLLSATFTGTAAYDQVYFIDVNASGDVFAYGQTAGSFPVTAGVYSNAGSGQFLQRFPPGLDSLVYSTVFGSGRGVPDISPTAFLVNDCNNIYMSGWGGLINTANGFWHTTGSATTGMVTTPDAFQSTTSGSDFYFIVLTEDARELLYATFLGGTLSRTHVDGGTSRFDKAGVVYHSVCAGCAALNGSNPPGPTSDFPTTAGAWSRVNRSTNCNNAAFKFDLSSLKARLRTNTVRRDMPGVKVICLPDPIVFENFSTGGQVYEWNFGDGTEVVRSDTTHIVHAYRTAGEYSVKLKAIDPGTCQVVDSAMTTVTVNEPESFVQDDADVCAGTSYRLEARGGKSYHWTSSDPSFVSFDARPVVNPSDTIRYYLVVTEDNGCVRRDTVQVNVIPAITPDFEWFRQAACTGRPELEVLSTTDSLKATDALFFDFGDGKTSDLDTDRHAYERDGVYHVRLVAHREFCVFEKGFDVPMFEFLVPNVITPGRPEHNDVFTIRFGAEGDATPADYGYRVSVVIYNRWGDLVYKADDYAYDWTGEGLAAGIYYYEVTIEGHTTCRSWLHLVK